MTADGGVASYGAARNEGGLAGTPLNAPILSIASTSDGGGYWMVAADGGIFSFGDARFHGSSGNRVLNRPIVSMATTPDGGGYWLVASDGGIFAFGDAAFYGSTGGIRLNSSIVGMAATNDGRGYWLLGSDGGVFSFGDAAFYGSAGGRLHGGSAIGMITAAGGGYWIATTNGGVISFGAAPVLTMPPVQAPRPSAAGSGPLVDITPSAAFAEACYAHTSVTCDSEALAAIDAAHAAEGLVPLRLPAGYSGFSPTEQLVAVTNAERQARGLPSFAGEGSLDALALTGAQAQTDPSGPPNTEWASIWAGGYATPLAADFAWMYDDGVGSPNIDCTASNTGGCWGHRDNILVSWGGSIGAAFVTQTGSNSMAEVFVAS